MFFTGYPAMAIIRVVNKTNQVINKVRIFHDGYKYNEVYLKKIKADNLKQTGVSTVNIQTTDLKVNILDNDSEFIIKKDLTRNYKGTIVVTIKSIESNGQVDFDITFE